jgi:hypothetical protein
MKESDKPVKRRRLVLRRENINVLTPPQLSDAEAGVVRIGCTYFSECHPTFGVRGWVMSHCTATPQHLNRELERHEEIVDQKNLTAPQARTSPRGHCVTHAAAAHERRGRFRGRRGGRQLYVLQRLSFWGGLTARRAARSGCAVLFR